MAALRLLIVSGSACPPGLVQDLNRKLPQAKLVQLWGMTELQAGLYTRLDDPPAVAATSAGRPSPGTEVRLVTADGRRCAPGEEGELQVRGCSVFPGYFDNPAANAEAFTADGWFRTGDLAVMDAAGNVSLTGRLKDVINRGGVKFNPRDVEDVLDQHPGIVQAAVVPMPDPVLGERVCCFVVPASGHTITLAELCDYLGQRGVAKTKWPERLELVAELPMTPTRKVIKGQLQALLAQRLAAERQG